MTIRCNPEGKPIEVYLGDGLYASFDGFAIWLRAPRYEGDHQIALEPEIFARLVGFANEKWGGKTWARSDS